MERRRLFKTPLGLAVLAAGTPRRARADVPSGLILIQTSPRVGFEYHAGARRWPRLRAGQALTLVREPHNRQDPRAVRADWRGQKLGYLRRVGNTAVSQVLDRGMLRAAITALRESRDPWQRVELIADPAWRAKRAR